ncbi:MAG: glycosyltransferase family 4 protein [Bacteroidales bacterium]|nr:glycosyltransferase family 4 protein [Bacteroidales bacterium]
MMVSLLIAVFIFSFLLTFFVKKFAEKKSIVDIPNERSSHIAPTPRGGGIAIVIVWFLGITYLFFSENIKSDLYFALLGGIPLMIIGIIDDIINVKPVIRLSVQSFSAILALYFLGGLTIVDFGCFIFSNIYLNSIFIFIVILWFINLFNFIDGIDGYLSTGVIMFCIVLFVLTNNYTVLVLASAVAGFLIWNRQPAKIFMGDVGSTLLGFNFIVFAVYFQNTEKLSVFIPIILSSIFWFDATLTLYRRWRNNEKLSLPHKKHAYQRLVQAGFSHQKVVLLFVLLNLIITGIVFLTDILFPEYILAGLTITVIILFFAVKFVDNKKPF